LLRKKAKKASAKKRVRRTPEDARAQILDAAEAIMANAGGPAALRLAEVAKQAGMSHPTILHHFGSREGLVRAINHRALERLTAVAVGGPAKSSDNGLKAVFATYRDGLAQRMVWLMQSKETSAPQRLDLFEKVVENFHQVRRSFAQPGAEPDMADSRAVIHLSTLAAFGDALIGPRLRHAGPRETQEREAFERWFAKLLNIYLDTKAVPPK
jgi:AcrR family transcriptional regulator